MKETLIFVMGVAALLFVWEVRSALAELVRIAIEAWREARGE